jgi:hypothetical protein
MLRGLGGLLPSVPVGGGFVDGLVFLAYLGVMSFLFLVLFYFLAESTLLWVDIAHNMRVLRAHFVPAPGPIPAAPPAAPPPVYQAPIPPAAPAYQAPAPPPAPVFQAPPPPPPPPPAPRYPVCGVDLEPGSAFCGNCGTRLR